MSTFSYSYTISSWFRLTLFTNETFSDRYCNSLFPFFRIWHHRVPFFHSLSVWQQLNNITLCSRCIIDRLYKYSWLFVFAVFHSIFYLSSNNGSLCKSNAVSHLLVFFISFLFFININTLLLVLIVSTKYQEFISHYKTHSFNKKCLNYYYYPLWSAFSICNSKQRIHSCSANH